MEPRTSLSSPYSFTLIDYLVLIALLLISMGIGLYHALSGGKQKTTSEFLLADRTVHPIIAAISLVASFLSGITMLGVPAEMYLHGTMFWYYCVAYIICGAITCVVFIPVFMELQITSVYEYLEMRFNRIVRLCGFTVFSAIAFIYLGVVLYAPALALNAVTGITLWGSVLMTGVACIFYTAIGGLWAVLWTDVFQIMVMLAAFLSVFICGCIRVGGIGDMWRLADEGGRIIFNDFRLDPTIRHTFWSVAIGGGFLWTAYFTTNQANLQRWLAVGTTRKAQITIVFTVIGMGVVVTLASLCGLTMYAFYDGCDLLQVNAVEKTDQLLVYFILELFSNAPGFTGFFTSGVFSAALSTLSSALNALVAVTIEDIIKLRWANISDDRLTIISKYLVLIYGIVVIGIAYLVSLGSSEILQFVLSFKGMLLGPLLGLYSLGILFPWPNSKLVLGFQGMILGPLLGVFCLGTLFPWPNSKGAISGLVVGITLNLWIEIGALIYPPHANELPLSIESCNSTINPWYENMTDVTAPTIDDNIKFEFPLHKLYSISYAYYAFTGWFTTIFIGFLVSFLTGANSLSDIKPNLMTPIANKFYSLGCFHGHMYTHPDEEEYRENKEEEALELAAKEAHDYASINR